MAESPVQIVAEVGELIKENRLSDAAKVLATMPPEGAERTQQLGDLRLPLVKGEKTAAEAVHTNVKKRFH